MERHDKGKIKHNLIYAFAGAVGGFVGMWILISILNDNTSLYLVVTKAIPAVIGGFVGGYIGGNINWKKKK